MKTIRVFPRKTTATPTDALSAVNRSPWLWEEADAIEVSVAFTSDIPLAEKLAWQWKCVTSNVTVGGPAINARGGDFVSGRYLKPGYTITSRGCPNNCWFCDAWRREGREIRTLPIVSGYNVLDNNILACPREHIEAVFAMLEAHKKHPRFTGGFEAARLDRWHIDYFLTLKPELMWFAYDTLNDFEPLCRASDMLKEAGIIRPSSHSICCYVLCGWKGDTFDKAETRMKGVVRLGFFPQAMLYNRGVHFDKATMKEWRRYARTWANKVIVGAKLRGNTT